MEETFIDMLQATASITTLVGSGDDARIYPLLLPQAPVFPAITYQVISGPRDYTQDGADRVVTWRVQANCYGNDYAEAKALRDAFDKDISGLYNRAFGSPPVVVQGCFIDNERDFYEEALAVLPNGIPYRKTLDLLFTVGGVGA